MTNDDFHNGNPGDEHYRDPGPEYHKMSRRIVELAVERDRLKAQVLTWQSHAAKALAENEKLKALLLFTDPAVSHVIVNDRVMDLQLTEFERWKKEREND